MIRKIENISKQIEDQIQIKELEVSNIIRDVPPIILILERGFVEMKSLVLSENFKTNSDEIHFFKETKPKLDWITSFHGAKAERPFWRTAKCYAGSTTVIRAINEIGAATRSPLLYFSKTRFCCTFNLQIKRKNAIFVKYKISKIKG